MKEIPKKEKNIILAFSDETGGPNPIKNKQVLINREFLKNFIVEKIKSCYEKNLYNSLNIPYSKNRKMNRLIFYILDDIKKKFHQNFDKKNDKEIINFISKHKNFKEIESFYKITIVSTIIFNEKSFKKIFKNFGNLYLKLLQIPKFYFLKYETGFHFTEIKKYLLGNKTKKCNEFKQFINLFFEFLNNIKEFTITKSTFTTSKLTNGNAIAQRLTYNLCSIYYKNDHCVFHDPSNYYCTKDCTIEKKPILDIKDFQNTTLIVILDRYIKNNSIKWSFKENWKKLVKDKLTLWINENVLLSNVEIEEKIIKQSFIYSIVDYIAGMHAMYYTSLLNKQIIENVCDLCFKKICKTQFKFDDIVNQTLFRIVEFKILLNYF